MLQCVDKMRQNFGNDDIRVGAALHNMAGLYASTHPPQLDKAEALLTEALAVSAFGNRQCVIMLIMCLTL